MLRPSKHSNPDQTVFATSMLVLKLLRKNRLMQFEALRREIKKKVIGGETLFLPAMHFLFLLGLVEYRRKTDAFEYIEKNAAN